MKTLYLLRHAKSDWSDPRLEDRDRPLSQRGIDAARLMGGVMREEGFVPAAVLCSSARRAVDTWELVGPALRRDVPLRLLPELYLAAPEQMLAILARLSDDLPSVLLLGHNPGMHHLATALCGPGSDEAAMHRLHKNYPSATLAIFTFEAATWAEVAPGRGRLIRFLRPRDLA